ncbi:MAG: hypothetical protein AMJ43_05235 [Coxiella sp. DG_40]|nr:MAG: hypothetical protein AMJ43_05235 [Coxiella sp. DG_40]
MKYQRFLWLVVLCPLLMGSLLDNTKTTGDQILNLSTQDFGLYGPLAINFQYSKELGVFIQGKFTQLINPFLAASLDIEGGKKLHRYNGTFGYLLTPEQRLKFSVEYLTQNLIFDFDSGEVNKWIGQSAYGLTYEYLLPYNFVRSIALNTFYSKAQSKDLSPKIYFDQNNQLYEDFRHIAGGTDTHGGLELNLLPTRTTSLGLQLSYDNLNYDTKYPDNNNNRGLGYAISLQQLLTNRLKLQLLANNVQAYQDYQAEIDWMLRSLYDARFELGLNGERIIGKHGLQSDTRVGVNINLRFAPNKTKSNSGYDINLTNNFNDLASWTAEPAVYMAQVLAIKDEYKVALGTDPFANPNTILKDINIPYGTFFSKSYEALNLFIDPLQQYNTLQLKAVGEEKLGLQAKFTPDPNKHDNGTLTISGRVTEPDLMKIKDKGTTVVIYARNFKDAPNQWSKSTQHFGINMYYTNPVVRIPEQNFHLDEEVNKDLTNYIDFGSEKLQEIKADSLNDYGLKINLSQDGNKVTLIGTTKKSASQKKITIAVKNSAGKTSEGNLTLNISDTIPTFTLTCPKPDSDFYYDRKWCETHSNSPVNYYGEKDGYKFELNTQLYGHIYCNNLPKPGQMKFFGAYISDTPKGPRLACRYKFTAERQWLTTQSIPTHSEFHYHFPSKTSCTPNDPTVEKCQIDLKS